MNLSCEPVEKCTSVLPFLICIFFLIFFLYTHFDIQQAYGNYDASRKSDTNKYLQRIRRVLNSQLKGKNNYRHQHVYSAGHQIPCWYNNLAKGNEATDINTQLQFMDVLPKSSTL